MKSLKQGKPKLFAPHITRVTLLYRWGEFDIQIRIAFIAESGEKPVTVYHHLKLHPWAVGTDGTVSDQKHDDEHIGPVHAWQYDEIVFNDPTESLYNIMMQHAPTPL